MEFAYYSDVGGRRVNEDTVAFVPIENGFCALVADGLGGQGNGDTASRTAVSRIADAFRAHPSCAPEDICRYFSDANDAVCEINGGRQNTMTTMVGLFRTPRGAVYAHVGDSRLYHFFNGRIVERTLDHSVPQVAVALGEITEDQIRSHPDRNRILRAIGSAPEVKTETHTLDLQPGFHAFLLCSDGFWEYVFENEMEVDLAKSSTPDQWLELLRQRRSARAPADADNNSAILIFM